VVDTLMRIALPEPLAPGSDFRFSVEWSFNVPDQDRIDSRGGYEHFPETDTYIYFLGQWFPRMAAYTDYGGWQNKAFLGTGEFTLEFGNYDVAITVPADHIVSATGVLQNPDEVLTPEQRRRLERANAEKPVFIVTPDEARANERGGTRDTKTWRFRAENVRDFGWASSRKFIWDAMIREQPGAPQPEVLAMSFYPNEAEPLWSEYSTHAVVHALDVYSRFTFPYPYPKAQSVHTWKSGGMEYPMITFNGYRPEPFEQDEDTGEIANPPEETWSRRTHYGVVGVVIHEIGHSYFPMVLNSDERQWSWLDEGLNSFLEYLAELEWEENFPTHKEHVDVLDAVTEYMTSDEQVPIMTQADATLQRSPNAYTKPTSALVVLRETVLGRELFDYAFREYARRWMFKRPTPADFFRTMEDASGVDLDWFWRGWFYSTDHVDVGIAGVRQYKISTRDPDVEFDLAREEQEREVPEPLPQARNREEGRKTYLERHPDLEGFYSEHDRFTVTNADRNEYRKLLKDLEDKERKALLRAAKEDDFVYFVDFENPGGLPTPLPLTITYENGDAEELMLPAEIWRRDDKAVTKVLIRDDAIASIEVDRRHQTADADYSNNRFPQRIEKSRIELYKKEELERDLMRDRLVPLKEQ
ncbi:MAG TPA: M1 family metallopeptidase, partial [Woeseiaceae bacterium]|nr:M1 family metallopeptidase [Woeseiaceae bacterium]